jgi:hypothetical protein
LDNRHVLLEEAKHELNSDDEVFVSASASSSVKISLTLSKRNYSAVLSVLQRNLGARVDIELWTRQITHVRTVEVAGPRGHEV